MICLWKLLHFWVPDYVILVFILSFVAMHKCGALNPACKNAHSKSGYLSGHCECLSTVTGLLMALLIVNLRKISDLVLSNTPVGVVGEVRPVVTHFRVFWLCWLCSPVLRDTVCQSKSRSALIIRVIVS